METRSNPQDYAEIYFNEAIQLVGKINSKRHHSFDIDLTLIGLEVVTQLSFPSSCQPEKIKRKVMEKMKIPKGTVEIKVARKEKYILLVPKHCKHCTVE